MNKKELEDFIKKNFSKLEINLRTELDEVSHMVAFPMERLNPCEFKKTIEYIKSIAEKNNYFMRILCELPSEAGRDTGQYLIQERKIYYFIFEKKKEKGIIGYIKNLRKKTNE